MDEESSLKGSLPLATIPNIGYNGGANLDKDETSYLYKPKKRKKKKRSLKDLKSPRKEVLHEMTPSLKRIDYVLVHENKEQDGLEGKALKNLQKNEVLRQRLEHVLVKEEKMQIEKEVIGELTFVKIHCPFPRLSEEAEKVHLQMPLREGAIQENEQSGCLSKCEKYFVTDNEQDYVSAPYETAKRHVFKGFEDPETFFRPALRSYLVNHILINMDISEGNDEKDEDHLRKKGLPFLLMKKAYTDGFILHDESAFEVDKRRKDYGEDPPEKERESATYENDARKEMNDTWCKFTKFQPLWKIRNYFGEKIAFYFAWSGTLITTLWIPALLGLAITGYGLYLSVEEYRVQKDQVSNNTMVNTTNTTGPTEQSILDEVTQIGLDVFSIVKESFDNKVTPYFGIIICLWGTLFLEIWKRKNARLAYEWDVDTFEDNEPDRPQFYGTKERIDPVSELPDWYYPFYRQFIKFMMSCGILIFMVCLVIASVVGVIIYRVIARVNFSDNTIEEFIFSTLISSVLNSVSIMVMGKVYEILAYKLTDWENHRTQTSYDDALIIKIFAFQFVNSYVSLYYIAFFREQTTDGGILDLGDEYEDTCTDGNCMSMLSFQVLVLMLLKPLPKFSKDVLFPWLKKVMKKIWRRCKRNKVDEANKEVNMTSIEINDFLEKERQKPPVGDVQRSPPVGDFTLMEYNEKIIQYGYLMLFSCSLPLAPIIALLTNLFDIRVDAKRLLWFNRRPVALLAQDIGMWYGILEFINISGVVTNAFLIAFTSSWGRENLSLTWKLWYIIIFEHAVFAIKFVIAYIIPDTPTDVSLAIRRERYQVTKILETAPNMPIEEGEPMLTSATAHIATDYAAQGIGLSGSGVPMPLMYPAYEKHNDAYTSPIKTSSSMFEEGPSRLENLSYGKDGTTYLDGKSDKFPETVIKPKRRKKKKKHPPMDEHDSYN
ncbi:anoctamin-7-like [Ptychodera flava]|uniref:anoctamin-7-like n=1 Tax=Ptychodera flava TaxID=63121 RepID=UPI00396A9591